MLTVSNLAAGYGDIIAVRDLSFSIGQGEILAILGANGAGKSTTLMSLMGLTGQKGGIIDMEGTDISNMPIEARISHGLAIAPEGRRVFPDLSVRENLVVGGHVVSESALSSGIQTVFGYFPTLEQRKDQAAGTLSGGEQQMLAIGRALISKPKLLIIDELSLGLMPKVVDECYEVLDTLKNDNIGILLVEQNTERALSVADRICVLEAGNQIWAGTAKEAQNDAKLTQSLMGIH